MPSDCSSRSMLRLERGGGRRDTTAGHDRLRDIVFRKDTIPTSASQYITTLRIKQHHEKQ